MTGYIKKKKFTSQKLFDAFVFITLTIMKANVDGRLMSSFLYRYGSPPGLERISPELPWLYISLINISLDLGISSKHPQYRLVVSMHSVSSQWVSRMLSREQILVVYAAFFYFATTCLPALKLISWIASGLHRPFLFRFYTSDFNFAYRKLRSLSIFTQFERACLSLRLAAFLARSNCLNRQATQVSFDLPTKLRKTHPQLWLILMLVKPLLTGKQRLANSLISIGHQYQRLKSRYC